MTREYNIEQFLQYLLRVSLHSPPPSHYLHIEKSLDPTLGLCDQVFLNDNEL